MPTISPKPETKQGDFSHNSNPHSPPRNRRLKPVPIVWQPELFATSEPVVSLQPFQGWTDRYSLTIQQCDCAWQLCPSLSSGEGARLLALLAETGIGFDLDLNEGWPLQAAEINWLTESLLTAEVG